MLVYLGDSILHLLVSSSVGDSWDVTVKLTSVSYMSTTLHIIICTRGNLQEMYRKYFLNNNTDIYLKSKYAMYIEIRVQWTIHKMGWKFKQCDKYVIIQEFT